MNTIDLINIKDRDSYTVVTDFVPENFVPTPIPTPTPTPTPIMFPRKSKINIILVSALGAAGFLIISGGSVILRYYRSRRSVDAIPTPGDNYERSNTNYLPSTPSSIYERSSNYNTYNDATTRVDIYVSNS